jgi:hypothetical protein
MLCVVLINIRLYAFFWVIPRRLNLICRRVGTLCLLHLFQGCGLLRVFPVLFKFGFRFGVVWVALSLVGGELPMKIQQTQCTEKLPYKIQPPGNYPEESIQQSEHGESLKTSNIRFQIKI